MTLKMSRDEALSVAFRKDWWLLLKIPVAAILAWSFFLPQLWKIGVLVITALASGFRIGSPVGQDVSSFHLYFMLVSMAAIVFAVFWYVVYVFAYFGRPGIAGRTIGITGVLLFPVIVIAVALLVGGIGTGLGIPQETFWGYLDRWTPVKAWRTRQVPQAVDLESEGIDVRELREHLLKNIGAFADSAGAFVTCATDPHLPTDESLAWHGHEITLGKIVETIAAHFGDEGLQFAFQMSTFTNAGESDFKAAVRAQTNNCSQAALKRAAEFVADARNIQRRYLTLPSNALKGQHAVKSQSDSLEGSVPSLLPGETIEQYLERTRN